MSRSEDWPHLVLVNQHGRKEAERAQDLGNRILDLLEAEVGSVREARFILMIAVQALARAEPGMDVNVLAIETIALWTGGSEAHSPEPAEG